MSETVLMVGCGDIGGRVAALHLAQGARVSALARSPARCAQLEALGVAPVSGDLDDASSLAALPAQHALVYYFAPPPEAGLTDPRMGRFLQAITRDALPHKIVYISTSGVYGDCKGAWVTEDTPPHPQTARAQARLDAETRLLAWSRDHSVPVVILRVGGIYGPGRQPVERIRRGEPVLRREAAPFTNRIHADDLARVCLAAAGRGGAGRIYNVCDDEHSTMTDYFNAVADALGRARPPQISLAEAQKVLSPGMLSYLNESRRMDNRRMREELGVVLRYPNLAAGLADPSLAAL
ncbi:MAG: SDR family oxidoreductase [Gammaproteobacteria bacterium]|nr:SDR family oxidoreductase [Gammaproteobacteria bacterium]